MKISFEDVRNYPKVKIYIQKADEQLDALGYTEHGERHAKIVAKRAGKLLEALGYDQRTVELAKIAGYLHDIGNMVNRDHHAQVGAILAQTILLEMGMEIEEVADIMTAIGNHHEEDGYPVSVVSAALILADKSDVHRSRVRSTQFLGEDIHDRVNYAATKSTIDVVTDSKKIIYDITIDTEIAPVLEYFQIFLSRMLMAQKAARVLGCDFELYINKTKMV